jgi:hypothetical protein
MSTLIHVGLCLGSLLVASRQPFDGALEVFSLYRANLLDLPKILDDILNCGQPSINRINLILNRALARGQLLCVQISR